MTFEEADHGDGSLNARLFSLVSPLATGWVAYGHVTDLSLRIWPGQGPVLMAG